MRRHPQESNLSRGIKGRLKIDGKGESIVTATAITEPRFTSHVEDKIQHIARKHKLTVLEVKHQLLRLMPLVHGYAQDPETLRRSSLG